MAKKEKDRHTIVHKTQHRKVKTKKRKPDQKTWGDLRCYGRVSRSCATCGTGRVAYVSTKLPRNKSNSLGHSYELQELQQDDKDTDIDSFQYQVKLYLGLLSNKVISKGIYTLSRTQF